MSLEENPVFHIYDRLMPSAWSGVTQKKVYARARCFLPGVDDVEIVKLIHTEIRPSVFGQVGPAQCRAISADRHSTPGLAKQSTMR